MNDYQDENVLTKITLIYSYTVRIFKKEEDGGYLISKKKYNTYTFNDEFKFNPYEFISKVKNINIFDPIGFGSKFIRHCKEIRTFIKGNDMTKFELNIKSRKNSFTVTIIDSKTHAIALKVLVSLTKEFIEEKLYEFPKMVEDTDKYQPPVIESPVNFTLDKQELIPVYRALISGIEDMYINNWHEVDQAEVVKSVSDRLNRLICMEIWNEKSAFMENVKTNLKTQLNSRNDPHNPQNK